MVWQSFKSAGPVRTISTSLGLFTGGYVVGWQAGYFPSFKMPFSKTSSYSTTPPPITQYVYFDVALNEAPLGRILLGLYGETQPKTVANFAALCLKENKIGFSYHKTPFHRIIPGFMLQGGDVTNGNGTGGMSMYGRRFKDEDLTIPHSGKGTLSMANAGANSNNSQFFICTGETPWLDGKHVVFGKVVDGMDVVDAIEAVGTPSGAPTGKVTIMDAGTWTPPPVEEELTPLEALKERLDVINEMSIKLAEKKKDIAPDLYSELIHDLEMERARVQKALPEMQKDVKAQEGNKKNIASDTGKEP